MPVSPGSLSAVEVASGAARALVPLDAVRTVIRLAGARVSAGAGGAMVRFERETVPLGVAARGHGPVDRRSGQRSTRPPTRTRSLSP